MHFLTLFPLFLAVLTPTFASPASQCSDDCNWDGKDGRQPRRGCLSDRSAERIVTVFESFFTKIDVDRANKLLAPEFQLFSDSTNYASPNANYTAGAVTNPSRDQFIAQQQAAQAGGPSPTFQTLAVYHSCDSITFRWRLGLTAPPVSGIDVLIIKPGTHQIQIDYSEYNNVGLLANFGCLPTGGLCGPGNGTATS